jgi:hypothetical protein
MPLHPTFRRTYNSDGMQDLGELAMMVQKPEEVIGEDLP